MGGLARSNVGRQFAIFNLKSMASRTKQEIVRERIYLTFPQDLIKEPVLSMLSKRFDIVFNIRGSTVTSNLGLVALEIDGKAAEVAKAIGWLKGKGVSVEPIKRA